MITEHMQLTTFNDARLWANEMGDLDDGQIERLATC